jgi:hypothetical protein
MAVALQQGGVWVQDGTAAWQAAVAAGGHVAAGLQGRAMSAELPCTFRPRASALHAEHNTHHAAMSLCQLLLCMQSVC